MPKTGVYQIRNRDSGAMYIGSAISLASRKTTHWWALRHGRHFNTHLQNAWNKYGESAFVFEVIVEGLLAGDLVAGLRTFPRTVRRSEPLASLRWPRQHSYRHLQRLTLVKAVDNLHNPLD